MKEKEMYTFNELLENLKMPVSELCRRAKLTEGTIARIKKGFPTRRSTANKLLGYLSEIYERELSLENVEGLNLQYPVIEKSATAPLSIDIPAVEVAQTRPTMQNTDIPDHLPEGTVKMMDFAEGHGVRADRMREWIREGISGEKIETTIATTKRLNGGSRTHFLTPEQQSLALDFLYRHSKLKTSQRNQEEKPVAEERPWWSGPEQKETQAEKKQPEAA